MSGKHARSNQQGQPVPLRVPIRRRTAVRLCMARHRGTPTSIIRLTEPVSERALRDLELRFAGRVPAYRFLLPDQPEPPQVVRTPPQRPPWRRGLLARSCW